MHTGLEFSQAVPLNKKNINPDAYRAVVMGRRSIRHYKDKPVPGETIDRIIETAGHSPTASNEQNVGYIVVTNRELIKDVAQRIYSFALKLYEKTERGPIGLLSRATGLSQNRYLKVMGYIRDETSRGRDFILHNAPALVLLHGPKKGNFISDNCNIAATNIINYSYALGLGSCFIGFLTVALRFSKKLRARLHVPPGRRVYASLVLGYPAFTYKRSVSRNKPGITWL